MNIQTLLTGWNFLRWFRLVLSVAIIFQAIETKDMFYGVLALLLVYQTIANVGCCGVNDCTVPPAKNSPAEMEEPEYEELKTN
jgi:hypothetical protein